MAQTESIVNTPAGIKLRKVLRNHQETINQISWSPDGKFLASVANDAKCIIWDVEKGEAELFLDKHITPLYSIAWSPGGNMIASGSYGPSIRIWDSNNGRVLKRFRGHSKSIYSMTWDKNGKYLFSGAADKSVCVWDVDKSQLRTKMKHHADRVFCVALSPNGQIIASSSKDESIHLWNPPSGNIFRVLKNHTKGINSIIWSPDGKFLVSGSDDATIRIWDTQSWKEVTVLESSAAITSLSFSFDGKLLSSSCADDTIQIWRSDKWHIIASLIKPDSYSWRSSAIFHPFLPQLATLSEGDLSIYIWDYDLDKLLSISREKTSITYKNAKVLLLGDTGVGKSGLGMVLAGKPFEPTDSTHGRQVWTLDRQIVDSHTGDFETRETILWDLAGQPGYRLVHQLHLNEVTVALIVFDSRSETDPFSGVKYWVRALNQSMRIQGDSALPMKKILVAARADRGNVGVSQARIDELCKELEIDKHFQTSAKEGWGINDLRNEIKNSINWENLAKVNSSKLFQEIRQFILTLKTSNHLLFTRKDLYQDFVRNSSDYTDSANLNNQFITAIGRVESRGLIRQLSFGSLILLQPELLDSYASALVNAARFEPDGMGSIFEEDAHRGSFRMPKDERIFESDQEKLLLISTIEDMIKQELVLREYTADGVLLVFPSEFTRENPSLPVPEGQSLVLRFHGPVHNIYTTLVVRLSYSGFFDNREMWKNATIFSAKMGGECGLYLRYEGDGVGELITFFNIETNSQTRMQFEEYIYSHLLRKVSYEKLSRRRILVCPKCGNPIPQRHIDIRKERGSDIVMCSVCYPEEEVFISLTEPLSDMSDDLQTELEAMDQAADAERDRETAISIIRGKLATNDYDVFLCHNNEDIESILNIANTLKEIGILPWFVEWEKRPGFSWQESLEKNLDHIKSVAIFVNDLEKLPWENNEVLVYIRQFTKRNCPIIPVLLSNIEIPHELPLFLQGITWINFTKDNSDPIQKLIWGITGKREYLEAANSNTLVKFNSILSERHEKVPDKRTERQKLLIDLGANKIGVIIVIIKMLNEEQTAALRKLFDLVKLEKMSNYEMQNIIAITEIVIKKLSKAYGIKRFSSNIKTIATHIQRNNFSLDDFSKLEKSKISLPFIILAIIYINDFRFYDETKLFLQLIEGKIFIDSKTGEIMDNLPPEVSSKAIFFLIEIGRLAATELKERWLYSRKNKPQIELDPLETNQNLNNKANDFLNEITTNIEEKLLIEKFNSIQNSFELIKEWKQIKLFNEEEYNRQLVTKGALFLRQTELNEKITEAMSDIEKSYKELGISIIKTKTE